MNCTRRTFVALLSSSIAAASLAACSQNKTTASTTTSSTTVAATTVTATAKVDVDMGKWGYDSQDDVWYQLSIPYCTAPAAAAIEVLAMYVPGPYLTGTKNADGTYTCALSETGTVGAYTAHTAPVLIPSNASGYAAQNSPTTYDFTGLEPFIGAGFVYVYPGLRGRNNAYDSQGKLAYPGGAPWGVVDLKSAVRFLRYNAASLPGSMDRIFAFGFDGGGGQAALLGSSGDSDQYQPYLDAIGAPTEDPSGNKLSDAVAGAALWCPVTSFDAVNEGYEWLMGQYSETGTRQTGVWTKTFSNDLAASYATYVNDLALTDPSGTVLSLDATSTGVYAAGSYYTYLLGLVEKSLNDFLADTTFPYTPVSTEAAQTVWFPGGASSDRISQSTSPATVATPTVYATAQDYIDALNEDVAWIAYSARKNTAKVTDLGSFVQHMRPVTKSVGAFDSFDKTAVQNLLFGTSDNNSVHFDATMATVLQKNSTAYSKLTGWDSTLPDSYLNDVTKTDSLGKTISYRVNMYNPLYYLGKHFNGYRTTTVAPHWRIMTGLSQGDTTLTTEANLLLALQSFDSVRDVSFSAVWGRGHAPVERTGDYTQGLISWVQTVLV